MSISRQALKLAQKSLTHLCLCKDFLVLPPTGHIARGYLLDRTSQKGMFRLWRVILPLYRPTTHMFLNYSQLLAKGDRVFLSRENPGESAAVVRRLIADDIPNLEKVATPEDFLAHVAWMKGNKSTIYLRDLALTYTVAEHFETALKIFGELKSEATKEIAAWTEKNGSEYPATLHVREIYDMAVQLSEGLRTDRLAVIERIGNWERTNIEMFSLTETVPNDSVAACDANDAHQD